MAFSIRNNRINFFMRRNFKWKTFEVSKSKEKSAIEEEKIIIPPCGDGKIFKCANEVICDIPDEAQLLIGGFGLCGIPENLIDALVNQKTKNLIVVSNNIGNDDYGLGKLIKQRQVKKIIASDVRENAEFEKQYLTGEIELELSPEGTLAERIRAGGAGIPAFYTATAFGTIIQEGMFTTKYDKDGNPEESNEAKQSHEFDGKDYVLETAITGDFALIKAWRADTAGNLIFKKSARNFNPAMCKAAKISIAEVEEIVPVGCIDPDHVHLPGIYVDRIIQGQCYEKRIENLRTKQSKKQSKVTPANKARDRIIKRAALELKERMYVNLGAGLPKLISNYIPRHLNITLLSENGILGVGPSPDECEVDPDLINAGKETITVLPGASFFGSDDSFAMIRGGHIDLAILGAMQVSCRGDLANWIIPKSQVNGIGASMDLVSSEFTKIVVVMNHVARDGRPKILNECSLPLTRQKCVDLIITDLAVFEVIKDQGLKLIEIAPNIEISKVFSNTECDFEVGTEIPEMKQILEYI